MFKFLINYKKAGQALGMSLTSNFLCKPLLENIRENKKKVLFTYVCGMANMCLVNRSLMLRDATPNFEKLYYSMEDEYFNNLEKTKDVSFQMSEVLNSEKEKISVANYVGVNVEEISSIKSDLDTLFRDIHSIRHKEYMIDINRGYHNYAVLGGSWGPTIHLSKRVIYHIYGITSDFWSIHSEEQIVPYLLPLNTRFLITKGTIDGFLKDL